MVSCAAELYRDTLGATPGESQPQYCVTVAERFRSLETSRSLSAN